MMENFFERAVDNIIAFGDTDIFPYPFENYVIYDKRDAFCKLLKELDSKFTQQLYEYPPSKTSAIVPVGYTGFRWAAQIDPLWNAYLLALVLSLAEEIESNRIPPQANIVHSYRYAWNNESSELFDKSYSWKTFMETSRIKADTRKFVVICDISEFYGRINHHRIENALQHVNSTGISKKIMEIYKIFSDTYSVGIPVGGPASRIISELVLDQVDKLLVYAKIEFCRFSDDYHIFADSYEEAFKSLTFLSQKLLQTQVLQLQKTKTRIMSSEEFLTTSPKKPEVERSDDPVSADLVEQSQRLMWFSIHFDPYSQSPDDDYERLKKELETFDILGLLKSELQKSRVHISLARKIVQALKFLPPDARDGAVISMVENVELLYPIISNVLITIASVFDELGGGAKDAVIIKITDMINNGSYIVGLDIHMSFALRVICKRKTLRTKNCSIEYIGHLQMR